MSQENASTAIRCNHLFTQHTDALSSQLPDSIPEKALPHLAVGTLPSTKFVSEFDIYGVPLSGAI